VPCPDLAAPVDRSSPWSEAFAYGQGGPGPRHLILRGQWVGEEGWEHVAGLWPTVYTERLRILTMEPTEVHIGHEVPSRGTPCSQVPDPVVTVSTFTRTTTSGLRGVAIDADSVD
jgi:hypothetical protein